MTGTPRLPLALALAGLCLSAATARADGPPKLDIEKTCKSATAANLGVSDQTSRDGCLRSERDARAEAQRRWGDYTAPAKAQCARQFEAGGYPSYVEMVTCLELASGTVPTQPSGAGATGPGSPKDGSKSTEGTPSALTKEPSPNQRTNPIEVLDKK
ncbi:MULTISPECIES: hypothetical protein [Methylobacterium]|uniref:Lysozyme inhibitor LprI N-terminal domain-containing protein n=1 Tax=Methylobacterium jeotgali TaxID=381630 RepID=A0ABQ4SU29_9HYPH|nr:MULTISPECIES: hypothetical protein [Methylobacterium]GBU18260.1 hypothetical protein AwMethylo_24750 [Methylobacterium sp.]GJE05181.1 hypothetical protein AOPFMNJM_0478 [Methylobacterium jeotgali]